MAYCKIVVINWLDFNLRPNRCVLLLAQLLLSKLMLLLWCIPYHAMLPRCLTSTPRCLTSTPTHCNTAQPASLLLLLLLLLGLLYLLLTVQHSLTTFFTIGKSARLTACMAYHHTALSTLHQPSPHCSAHTTPHLNLAGDGGASSIILLTTDPSPHPPTRQGEGARRCGEDGKRYRVSKKMNDS